MSKKEIEKNIIKTQIAKKESTKKQPISTGSNEMSNLIKIILIVTAIFVVFYFITIWVTENKKATPEDKETTIQYDQILMGELFNQPNQEYLVLVKKAKDEYTVVYETYLTTYAKQDKATRYYTLNLDSGFNKKYIAEKNNITNDLKTIKFSGTILLKIKDKKIVASYDTEEKITTYLKSIIKKEDK